MIEPTIAELTKGKINRYELVIAIAKCARLVTDEYVSQRERADRMIANRETDKPHCGGQCGRGRRGIREGREDSR